MIDPKLNVNNVIVKSKNDATLKKIKSLAIAGFLLGCFFRVWNPAFYDVSL